LKYLIYAGVRHQFDLGGKKKEYFYFNILDKKKLSENATVV
jgi:hypothetical protein